MGGETLPVFVLACVRCGKTVSGGEDRCPRCGASFDGLTFECPFCGKHVTSGQHECDSCGTRFEAFAGEVAETSVISLDSGIGSSGLQPREDLTYECPACGESVEESDDRCSHCGIMFAE